MQIPADHLVTTRKHRPLPISSPFICISILDPEVTIHLVGYFLNVGTINNCDIEIVSTSTISLAMFKCVLLPLASNPVASATVDPPLRGVCILRSED